MENLSIGELFDKGLKDSADKTMEDCKNQLGKYMSSPYTFDLPPSPQKLLPRDPNYNFYICRANVSQNIINLIDSIIKNENKNLNPENRDRLSFIRDEMLQIASNKKNRTKEEMLYIKDLIQEAYTIATTPNS